MANQNVKMSKFKRAFQLLAANVSQREICEKLHMGRGVLTRYKNIVDERKISYVDLSRMCNEDIEQFLYDKLLISSSSGSSSTSRLRNSGVLQRTLSEYKLAQQS